MSFKTHDRVKASQNATRKIKDRLKDGGIVKIQRTNTNMEKPENGLVRGQPGVLVEAGAWLGWVGLDQIEKKIKP